ncbi:unnamed protein product [Pipistrellus nathusii]|uniref:Uncharacterized protein n=1 Tax=Pipistrellus nathusii TaxID=59473 RepID=A0ABN9ZGC4_PIPNA
MDCEVGEPHRDVPHAPRWGFETPGGPDRDIDWLEYEGRWQWQQPTGGSMNQSKTPEATAGPAFLSSIPQASIRTPGGFWPCICPISSPPWGSWCRTGSLAESPLLPILTACRLGFPRRLCGAHLRRFCSLVGKRRSAVTE